jgi:hypothetical protein
MQYLRWLPIGLILTPEGLNEQGHDACRSEDICPAPVTHNQLKR